MRGSLNSFLAFFSNFFVVSDFIFLLPKAKSRSGSKWWWRDKMHLPFCYGMTEPYLGSVEVEAVSLGAIELVTLDRTTQAVGMGTVDAQLVGAPCLGVEGDEVRVEELVIRYCTLSMLHIHHLPGTVHWVGTQR